MTAGGRRTADGKGTVRRALRLGRDSLFGMRRRVGGGEIRQSSNGSRYKPLKIAARWRDYPQ